MPGSVGFKAQQILLVQGSFTMNMVQRMSKWQQHDGRCLRGTHWDAGDREWEPRRVQYEWHLDDDVWRVNTSRFRVLEIYYDAQDSDLPEYVDPVVETTFLSRLPADVVGDIIWPRIFEGHNITNIQEVTRIRGVCTAWRSWVDNNQVWNASVCTHMENWLHTRRPWSGKS
jgi:hypothetical protein